MRNSLLFLLLSLVVIGCADDDTSGRIYGIASIGDGIVAVNATMSLYKFETYYETHFGKKEEYTRRILDQQKKTNDKGFYEFKGLSPLETYCLEAELNGYASSSDIGLLKSERMNVDVSLKKVDTKMSVRTLDAEVQGKQAFFYGAYNYTTITTTTTTITYEPSEVGFVYAMNSNPSNGGNKVIGNKGNGLTIEASVNDLEKGTYYVQAYAKNSLGTEFGAVKTFQVTGSPIVMTLEATNIGITTATLNGKIEYPGDPAYTEKGFVYSSTFPNPTIDDPSTETKKVAISGSSAGFSANIAALKSNSTYYVRTYVTNESGTMYGETSDFITKSVITTLATTNVTDSTATLNAKIESSDYTEKGFVYSAIYSTPTIDNNSVDVKKVVVVGTSSEFSINVTGLIEDVTYYVRAYVINENGTIYGETVDFSTGVDYYVLSSASLMVQKVDLSSGASWSVASNLCKSSRVGGFSDWRLPTRGELRDMFANQQIADKLIGVYWSGDSYYDSYWGRYYYYYYDKRYDDPIQTNLGGSSFKVRAVRTILK